MDKLYKQSFNIQQGHKGKVNAQLRPLQVPISTL